MLESKNKQTFPTKHFGFSQDFKTGGVGGGNNQYIDYQHLLNFHFEINFHHKITFQPLLIYFYKIV